MTPDSGDNQTDGGARLLHRRRDTGARPAWNADDLTVAASLAALLPAAWLLREQVWRGLCRAIARLPLLVDKAGLERTATSIQRCLPGTDARRAMEIARDLQAAVYELRLQNLRAWRPAGARGGGWMPRVTLSGAEHLDRALKAGRGAVLWVAHFAFNSNVTKIALAAHGHAVSHMSRPEHGFSKTRFGIAWLNPVRCIPEDRHLRQRIVFDRGNPAAAMRRMMATLGENGILSITAGAWEGSDLAEGAMLGGRLSIALGAPRLAARTGAALLPVFTVRDADGAFRVVVEAPVALPANPPGRAAACAAAQEYLTRHEDWVTRYPDQWRGWKEWRPA